MRIVKIRPIKGRNRYSHYPVIEMDLDLDCFSEINTARLPGFTDVLLEKLPTLTRHHCSLGFPGGFHKRLIEGTLLGHVVEHVALEMQALVDMRVVYGRTRQLQGSIYRVVFEYDCLPVGEKAAELAVEGVWHLLHNMHWDCESAINHLEELASRHALGPSTRAILSAARARGIPVLSMEDGSYFQLGYGCSAKRLRATITDQTSCNAVDISMNKTLTNQFLRRVCIPTPPGRVVEDIAELKRAWRELGDVVIKPEDSNQGQGVTVGVHDESSLTAAYRHAKQFSQRVLVEKRIHGHQLRVLVVGGKAVAVAERFPPFVLGNGKNTVMELIEAANADPRRGRGHERILTRISVDDHLRLELKRQGVDLHDVPFAHEKIYLGQSANLSQGGTAVDVTDQVDERILHECVRAAEQIGLDIAGIDLITPRMDCSMQKSGGAIIEVNAAPGIRMHTDPAAGKPRDVGRAIVDYLMGPDYQEIPLIAVTGTNGKTTTCRMLARMYALSGKMVGAATTEGVRLGDAWLDRGDCSGPQSAQTVLLDRRVEAAILETARGGILRNGLGYDTCRVGVVLNVQDDHLGQDQIDTLEDLAWVKELVVESVNPRNGWAVLNAENPYTIAMAQRSKCRVMLFATSGQNPDIQRHIQNGGRAVYFTQAKLVEVNDFKTEEIMALDQIPLLWQGRARYQMQNVAAAAAAARACELPLSIVRQALANFGLQPGDNPGRLQLWQNEQGVRIVLDYGHNIDGYRSLIETIRPLCQQRLWGVIGIPGDRSNVSMRRLGWVAASGFDGLIVKEDRNLRGRQRGEVAQILCEGARAHSARIPLEVELDEQNAVRRAVTLAESNDWIIVFYERLDHLEQLLRDEGFAPESSPFLHKASPEKELSLARRI